MTAQCRFTDCRRAAIKDGSRCSAHALRWLPAQPAERDTRPAWVQRMAQNAKDFSGGAA